MKAQLKRMEEGGNRYDALAFVCPGCEAMKDGGSGLHILPVTETTKKPHWKWNGDLVVPTVSPSILTRYPRGDVMDICHSFLREGVFEFLNDCTHPLAGQKVEMPDLPEWFIKE